MTAGPSTSNDDKGSSGGDSGRSSPSSSSHGSAPPKKTSKYKHRRHQGDKNCVVLLFDKTITCTLHRQHTQTKGGEIPASHSWLRSIQCQEGIYCTAHSTFTWFIITVFLSDIVNEWTALSDQVKKSESVHSNGQSKTKPTSQLLEPRNDKVGQQTVQLPHIHTMVLVLRSRKVFWCLKRKGSLSVLLFKITSFYQLKLKVTYNLGLIFCRSGLKVLSSMIMLYCNSCDLGMFPGGLPP